MTKIIQVLFACSSISTVDLGKELLPVPGLSGMMQVINPEARVRAHLGRECLWVHKDRDSNEKMRHKLE